MTDIRTKAMVQVKYQAQLWLFNCLLCIYDHSSKQLGPVVVCLYFIYHGFLGRQLILQGTFATKLG